MSDTVNLQYRAFIAHSDADAGWAKWLHGWLESFRADKELIGRDATGTIHTTLRPIFRHGDDFSDQALALAALNSSHALIVISSPASAKSNIVNEDIRHFKSRYPKRPIIPLIVDGKPGDPEFECFSPALRFKLDAKGEITNEPIEALYADAREEGDGKDLALAKIVASLLGASPDEVFNRSERGFRAAKRKGHRRELINRLKDGLKLGIKGSMVAGLVALIALAGAFGYFDYQRRQQLAAIEALVENYGTINASQDSAPEAGPSVIDAMTSITNGATRDQRYATALELLTTGHYQKSETLLKAVAEEKLAARQSKEAAEALRNLASIAAISDHERARGYYAKAAVLDPDHVEGMFWHGWFEAEAGSLDEAETAYRRVVRRAKAGNDDWAAYWARLAVGDIRLSRGDFSEATEEYQAASEMADRVADADTAGWQSNLPVAYLKVGDALLAQGNLDEALKTYRKGLSISERLAQDNPDIPGWRRNLVASYGRVGSVLAQQGETRLARDTLDRGRSIIGQLKDQFADDAQLSKQLAAFDADIAKLEQAQTAERGTAQSEQVAR